MAKRRKRCRFCGELFLPNPRLKGLVTPQYACTKAECQKERHRQSCARWNEDHRDQFQGRYPEIHAWLAAHPGYLSEYRGGHPVAAEKHRQAERDRLRRRRAAALDIQDAVRLQVLAEQPIDSGQLLLDIQDAIWAQLFVAIGLKAHYRVLDIQDALAPSLPRLYSSGKEIWQWAKRVLERAGD